HPDIDGIVFVRTSQLHAGGRVGHHADEWVRCLHGDAEPLVTAAAAKVCGVEPLRAVVADLRHEPVIGAATISRLCSGLWSGRGEVGGTGIAGHIRPAQDVHRDGIAVVVPTLTESVSVPSQVAGIEDFTAAVELRHERVVSSPPKLYWNTPAVRGKFVWDAVVPAM